MEKYQELNPNNARIFIDYRKEKKKQVKFEYIKTSGTFSIVFIPIFYMWIILNIILSISGGIVFISFKFFNSKESFSHVITNINFVELFVENFPFLFLFIYMIGLPLFVSLLIMRYKKLMRFVPYINSFIYVRTYEAIFNSENTKSKIIEIPLFSNVRLDYEAIGEFSKYLDRFEITEHPFNRVLRYKNKPKKKNEYLWKAKFYFSKIPKKGELKIYFH